MCRCLNEYRRKCERTLQYAEASRAKVHIKSLGVKELKRQQENMQKAQWQEMEQI
jgi:hypothetical protein